MNRLILIIFLLSTLRLSAQDDLNYLLKADYLRINQDYTTALLYIDSISDKGYYADFVKGEILFQQTEYIEAIQYYYSSCDKKPNYAAFELAKTYALLKQYDSASVSLKRHLQSRFKRMSNDISTEVSFSEFIKTEEWKSLNINSFYTKEEKSIERAVYYKNKQELSLALDILDELIADDKNFVEAYFYRADFIILLNQDYKYAINYLKKAVKIDATHFNSHHLLADFYFHEMKYKKALASYILAQQIFPYHLQDYLNIAKSYYRLGEYEKAIKYIDYYTEVNDRNIEALLLAGRIYYDKGNYQESINLLTRAININPRRIDVLVARGKSYLENDEYSRAGRDFNIALDLDIKNGEIWYLKGLAFLYQEKRDEACKYFKKAIYLNYYRADEYLLKECQ